MVLIDFWLERSLPKKLSEGEVWFGWRVLVVPSASSYMPTRSLHAGFQHRNLQFIPPINYARPTFDTARTQPTRTAYPKVKPRRIRSWIRQLCRNIRVSDVLHELLLFAIIFCNITSFKVTMRSISCKAFAVSPRCSIMIPKGDLPKALSFPGGLFCSGDAACSTRQFSYTGCAGYTCEGK